MQLTALMNKDKGGILLIFLPCILILIVAAYRMYYFGQYLQCRLNGITQIDSTLYSSINFLSSQLDIIEKLNDHTKTLYTRYIAASLAAKGASMSIITLPAGLTSKAALNLYQKHLKAEAEANLQSQTIIANAGGISLRLFIDTELKKKNIVNATFLIPKGNLQFSYLPMIKQKISAGPIINMLNSSLKTKLSDYQHEDFYILLPDPSRENEFQITIKTSDPCLAEIERQCALTKRLNYPKNAIWRGALAE